MLVIPGTCGFCRCVPCAFSWHWLKPAYELNQIPRLAGGRDNERKPLLFGDPRVGFQHQISRSEQSIGLHIQFPFSAPCLQPASPTLNHKPQPQPRPFLPPPRLLTISSNTHSVLTDMGKKARKRATSAIVEEDRPMAPSSTTTVPPTTSSSSPAAGAAQTAVAAAAVGVAGSAEPAIAALKKNEVRFGKHLASSDKRVRDRTVFALREWLQQRSKGGALTDLDLLKVCCLGCLVTLILDCGCVLVTKYLQFECFVPEMGLQS